ncbi:hypothetical protein C2I27_03840 [Priestia megaterium]|uniref:LysM peptidoglycan-binding domain-containing protein n=1 Tax=Priestia megaterium TaxID=1404 RepID=UPI000D513592|nr:LysM peptidoglycan-binding domain-containing protein [Priestia megaterium]PVC75028.1 hypothetical protein C2I27_03840 [Priestia megaterium]
MKGDVFNMKVIVIKRRNARLAKLRWTLISRSLMALTTAILIFVWLHLINAYYIVYVPYQVEKGDTLTKIVQENNAYRPWGWDSRDFVQLTVEKNNIKNSGRIRTGETILIPIAKEKE